MFGGMFERARIRAAIALALFAADPGCRSGAPADARGAPPNLVDADNAGSNATPRVPPQTGGLPQTCDEAVSRLLSTMTPELRRKVRSTAKDELIVFHLNWGMGIRNAFGLWGDNPQLLASCAATRPGTAADPEAVSQIIIEAVWSRLQSEDGGPRGDQ